MGSFNHDFSLAARGLGHRQQSSPSLDASAETLDLEDGHECIYQQRRDVEVRQPKKDRYVPSPSSSRPRHAKRVSTVIAGALPMDDQALKASPFAKFKAFGAKIKKAFGKKTRQPSSGIGVTTTTAVTAIEYKSEHPIPAPKSKPSSKEKMPRNQRRKSMPVHLLESRVSRPQPLRPTSFLAMDPGPSFRQLLPGNDSSQPSSAPWISRRPRSRSSGLNMPPSPGAKVSDTVPSLAPPESPQRIRSKSSPAMTGPSGSRLDLLRSTILPHPPIPNKPLVGNEYPRRLQAGHGRTEYAASLSRERGRIVGSSVSLSSEEGRDGHQRQATTSATSREATLDGYELIDCSTSDFVHTSPSSMRRRSATSNFRPSKDSKDTSDRKNSHSRSPSKRRYRGFSFTKRASKTVSSPAPPVPDLPKNLRGAHTRPGMALNTLLKGLSPQKKAEYLRQWQQQQRVGTPGCADYDPDLVLDTMSFAHIPDPTHSATTTTTNADLLISPDSIDVPIHAIHMDNLDGDVARDSPASGAPMDDTMEVELADREEERGYLRALGLEFDVVGAAEAF
ncbi:hypothetical protein PsYK624_021390 [Phanerochaete sordida]|uniref:Uncharacterized protein n=1 Tax=Phanerochaete sordida TaxID=48140 RepID=A0A9P3G1P6_9APHY|nr:hypothetical protein PsYK624_021390 [Phanerochaete sordida]